ncbi:MAG: bis-aminopropyl spermidine synthase family protein [Armatimonadetes bacterium]|nr:bis-aminopropyl spermidine synthase family protein [Armatimonadota bacterium]
MHLEPGSTRWHVSRHLEARRGREGEELAVNLCFGTRLIADPALWDLLADCREPRHLADGELVRKAIGAHLLAPELPDADEPDFVRRLDRTLSRFTGRTPWKEGPSEERRADLLEKLALAEQEFRRRHMPRPLSTPRITNYLLEQPHRLIDSIFAHTRTFLEEDLARERPGLDPAWCRRIIDRPVIKLRYEQQYCTPATTLARVERFSPRLQPHSRVLILGDDDLVSLAFRGARSVDVVEVDHDLVSFLESRAANGVRIRSHDLSGGLPAEMTGSYDLVLTDPPYAARGMELFLRCAAAALQPGPDSRLFLVTDPGLLEKPHELEPFLAKAGLRVERRTPRFSRYVQPTLIRAATLRELTRMGCPAEILAPLMEFPYLYADLLECRWAAGATLPRAGG